VFDFFRLVVNRNAILVGAMLLAAGAASAQEQTIAGFLSIGELAAGQSTNLTVSYTATDTEGLTTVTQGLGLRLHYDSSAVSLGDYQERLLTGSLTPQIKDDTSDADNDPNTDKFWLTSWANFDSGTGWPADGDTGEALAKPVNLYTVPLTAVSGFNGTTLNFSYSSLSAGYAFSGEPLTIAVFDLSLDRVAPELTIADSISLDIDMPGRVLASSYPAIADFIAAAVATDNQDDDSTLIITNNGLDDYAVGETLVTFSVLDAAGNTTTESASITLVVLDTDGDGLPNFYEIANGLEPEDGSDAAGDIDSDGISNLDEYTEGSDPTKDERPPELTIPADIRIAATGLMTDVALGDASAVDNKDGPLLPTPSATGLFKSGLYAITWSISDAAGNSSSAVQSLEIMPLANLTPSSITVEGATVEVSVELSGPAAAYPVTIPINIGGTASVGDVTVSADSIVITEGTAGMVTLNIIADSLAESEETVVITLGTPTNAALGSVTQRTVTIVEENVAPVLSLVVTQGGIDGRIVSADGGLLTVTASYTDVNIGDTHTFAWGAAVYDMPSVVIDGTVATFDPFSLGGTIVSAEASVTDSGVSLLTTSAAASIKILTVAPVLGDTDTDGDGVSDALEGYGDSDDDGIPDYKDNIVETYLAPTSGDMFMQSAVGTKISLGNLALAVGDNVGISEEDMGSTDADYDYLGGLFDFKVSGAQVGASYNIVLPLNVPVPAKSIMRKFIDANVGWQAFVENATNAISSATAASGTCPEAGSASYTDGLTVGATCIQLLIEDGGPNDADGAADGTVTDPSGIATRYSGPPSSDSTISISVAEIKAGGSETAVITVVALDSGGRTLEGMTVTAVAGPSGSTISSFSEDGEGVYTATLTPGNSRGNLAITASIFDGTDYAYISTGIVVVKKSGGGGCTVGESQSDLSLILLMLAALMLMARRRLIKTYKNINETE
jgi:hypothetical protein